MEEERSQLSLLRSAKEVVQAIMQLPDEKKLQIVALLWLWWTDRNRGNHGEKRQSVQEFQFSVRHHVQEWKDFLISKGVKATTVQCRWTPPLEDMTKVNVDAAFNVRSGHGGWGMICRNSSSDIQFAAAGSVNHLTSALHAETVALMEAVKLADQLGIGRVIFETDSLSLQQAIGSSSFDLSPFGHLFREIKFKMHTQFIVAEIYHVPRKCNKPAHVLAALGAGLDHGTTHIWYDDYPVDVTCAVTGDHAVS